MQPYILVPAVGDALLTKGAEYSLGKLVAELEGDGKTSETDPKNVWDRHFHQDLESVQGWPDDPRDPDELDELLEVIELFLSENPEKHLCEVVCDAHVYKNGLGDFKTNETDYQSPVSELTDDQLYDYLSSRLNNEPDEA